MTEFAVMADGDPSSHLRATYSFELGTWKATCRACGWRSAIPTGAGPPPDSVCITRTWPPPARRSRSGIPGDLAEDDLAPVLVDGRR